MAALGAGQRRVRLLRQRRDSRHLQAAQQLLVMQGALLWLWDGTRWSILPTGSRDAENLCCIWGASRLAVAMQFCYMAVKLC